MGCHFIRPWKYKDLLLLEVMAIKCWKYPYFIFILLHLFPIVQLMAYWKSEMITNSKIAGSKITWKKQTVIRFKEDTNFTKENKTLYTIATFKWKNNDVFFFLSCSLKWTCSHTNSKQIICYVIYQEL